MIAWNATDPLASVMKSREGIQHDDGFVCNHDPEAAYVAWDGEETHRQTIGFRHGGLEIDDDGHELQKKCSERSVDTISGSDTSLINEGWFRFLFRKEAAKENSSVSGILPICIKGCVALLKFAVVRELAFLFSVTLWLPMMHIF